MRLRILVSTALIAALVPFSGTSLPARATEPTDPAVVFEGAGWGHGVGMSQYGSRAMAKDGFTAEEIIEHYYTGASVAAYQGKVSGWLANEPEPLWVKVWTSGGTLDLGAVSPGLYVCQQEPVSVGTLSLVNYESKSSVYVRLLEERLLELGFDPGVVDESFTADTDAAVKAFQRSRGLVDDGWAGRLTKNALWEWDGFDRCVIKTPLTTATMGVVRAGSDCAVTGAAAPGDCVGSIRGLTPSSRVKVPQYSVGRSGYVEGIQPFELGHGILRIRPGSGTSIHAVAQLGVDDYVLGIHETILSWGSPGAGAIEALYAQAIASRSYGVGTAAAIGPESGFSASRKSSCWCNLSSTTSDQVYWGWYAESMYGAMWRSVANETAGKIVTHPQSPIVTAYFSSSNGGKTEDNSAWSGGTQVPYLQSVDDPWSLVGNPYASWSVALTPAYVASRVGLDQVEAVSVVDRNRSGSAKTVRFTGTKAGVPLTIDMKGTDVRRLLGLRSAYFDVEWGSVASDGLPVDPPPAEPPTETGPALPFDDIASSVFREDIAWLYDRGLTSGCNPPQNTDYCPEAKVTRGEMAVFLERALQLPPSTADHFDDDNGKFYEEAANRIYEAGVTSGCGPREFCGSASLPREQMAAFLHRGLGLGPASQDFFVDDTKSKFQESINRVAEADITRGCNPPANDRFCPTDLVTRGQLAAFLRRALD